MIDRLVNRPLPGRARGLCFALGSAMLVIVACIALVASASGGSGHARPVQRHPVSRRAAAGPRAAANAAARAFVAPYVDYLYGHPGARPIARASHRLRISLQAHPPHTSSAIRARRPRVVSLSVTLVGRETAEATVTIADGGPAAYPIVLRLRTRSGRWEVTGVVSE